MILYGKSYKQNGHAHITLNFSLFPKIDGALTLYPFSLQTRWRWTAQRVERNVLVVRIITFTTVQNGTIPWYLYVGIITLSGFVKNAWRKGKSVVKAVTKNLVTHAKGQKEGEFQGGVQRQSNVKSVRTKHPSQVR